MARWLPAVRDGVRPSGWRDPDGRPSCMLGWRGGNAAGEIRSAARPAPLAQSAERLHGKEKVYGSIP
jgi:hypothetical protein